MSKKIKFFPHNGTERQIKRTKRITSPRDNSIMIRITFKGLPGQPGDQITVSEKQYVDGVRRQEVVETADEEAVAQ